MADEMKAGRESLLVVSNRCFDKVRAHMQWDEDKTRLWFNTVNPQFGGITPFEFILTRPDKAEKIVEGLIYLNSPPDALAALRAMNCDKGSE